MSRVPLCLECLVPQVPSSTLCSRESISKTHDDLCLVAPSESAAVDTIDRTDSYINDEDRKLQQDSAAAADATTANSEPQPASPSVSDARFAQAGFKGWNPFQLSFAPAPSVKSTATAAAALSEASGEMVNRGFTPMTPVALCCIVLYLLHLFANGF